MLELAIFDLVLAQLGSRPRASVRTWNVTRDGWRRDGVDAVDPGPEVRLPGLEDVRHEGLRIAVVEREPGALHLDHDPVPLPEDVVPGEQVDRHLLHLPRGEGNGALEPLAEAAAQDLRRHHDLRAAEGRVGLHLLGQDVDELGDEVGVGAGGRDEEVGGDRAGEDHVLGERRGLPGEDVRPAVRRSAGRPPSRPARPRRPPRRREVRRRGRAGAGTAPGSRVGGPGPDRLGPPAAGRVEGEPPPVGEVHAPRPSAAGRPGGQALPDVRAGLEDQRLGERRAAAPLQVAGEEGRLDLLAEELRRGAPEGDAVRAGRRRRVARSGGPTAPGRGSSSPSASFALHGLVERHRPAPVLLVEGPAHVQGRRRGVREDRGRDRRFQ